MGWVQGEYVSSYFAVPKSKRSPDKWRPILKLKKFNKFVPYMYFRREDVKTVRKWFQQGTMCTGLDLKDAFLHVPMNARSRNSLGLNGRGNYMNGRSYHLVSNVLLEY